LGFHKFSAKSGRILSLKFAAEANPKTKDNGSDKLNRKDEIQFSMIPPEVFNFRQWPRVLPDLPILR
jgi:hypothetical protein